MSRDRYPDMPTLLTTIRARPGMFLGRPTIGGLQLFLSGIQFAEHYYELPSETRIGGFDRQVFELWVKYRYNPRRLSHSSFSLAASLAGDDEAGFNMWFHWYDEFVASPRLVRATQVPLRDGRSVQAIVTEFTAQDVGTGAAAELARWQCPCGSWMDAETETVAWFEVPRGFSINCSSCDRRYAITVEAGRCVGVGEVDRNELPSS
jgi:hypothetical protein